MSGKGGRCYTLNTFNKYLLEALGYDSYLVGSDIVKENGHVVTAVDNLKKPGDKYIVDVGLGVPNFEPIPLDFEDESPIYAQSFSEFKYARKNGKITRYHREHPSAEELMPPNLSEEVKWRRFYDANEELPRRELSFFDETFEELYTDLDCSFTPFNNSFRIVGFRGEYTNPKLVAFRNFTLLLENDAHKVEKVKLKSVEEILEKVDLYFPVLSDAAREAVKYCEFKH
jgi:arylamine N-acetyltransferase